MPTTNLLKEVSKPSKRGRGRPKIESKENVCIRLFTVTRNRLDKALAASRLNLSAYIELAIEDRLKKDKIP